MNTHSTRFLSFLMLSWQLLYTLGTTEVPIKCIESERKALLELKKGFVDNYDILSSWKNEESHRDCCEWDRVVCGNKTSHVEKLDLHGTENASLEGTLSPSLTQLTHLQYLDLSFNDFLLSHIPNFVSFLTNLRYLNLSYCYFEGKVPHEFGKLSHLQYLDLQSNLLDGEIPPQLSNLSELRYLDLTFNDFSGEIPNQLGNLSSLEFLFVGPMVWDLKSNLEWVSHLSKSLRVLRMEEVDLSSANNWPKIISTLPLLQELHLRDCNLPNSVSFSVSKMNLSKSLTLIDLSSNNQTSSIYPWLLNFNSSLAVLKLTDNFLQGSYPKSFEKFSFLQELWLGDNFLEGGVPNSLWNLCNLSVARLNDNDMTGSFVDFVPRISNCAKNSLKILDLSWNCITGTFPNVSHLSYLQEIYLDGNQISGGLSETIGHLSNLEVLSATENSLEGIISEAHFCNLSKLHNLDLRSNSLSFKLSANWIPPFQLKYIYLSGCKLGPHFPNWLHTQKICVWLDISNSDIADTVPQWFWYMSLSSQYVNVSHNQLTGVIPNLPLEFKGFAQVDLSSNQFQGPIPSFLSTARSLYLSNNNFTDSSLLLCTTKATYLFLLDLSNNQLQQKIPDCWMNLKALSILNLADNNLLGNIPTSMGLLFQIQAIHLRNNNLSGELLDVLGNCTELRILDVGHNKFSGPIPIWIGEKLQKLLVLIMKSNQFDGNMPLSLCQLSQIRILDISFNNLVGNIPSCVRNFTALASKTSASNTKIGYSFNSADSASYVYYDSASVTWKGKEWEYKNTLGLLMALDLSSNKLVSEIPWEITQLVGLISLNLSRNRLIGKIPSDIGKLEALDVLDLSRNFLFGRIPYGLSEIPRLSMLDLSYNNLSGEIPESTQLQSFNATDFEGNPELCGLPLPKRCPDEENDPTSSDGDDNHDESFLDYGFYISLVFGFIVGFWGVCGTLVVNRSWRFVYFKFFDHVYSQIYVWTTINMAKLHGMLKEFKERYIKRQENPEEVPDSIANPVKWISLGRRPRINQDYWSSTTSTCNNYSSENSDNSSMICELCDRIGHSAQNCDEIGSSSYSMPTGYCLDSSISSTDLYHKSIYEENDEIELIHRKARS